ncbi:hypothetical protein GWK47_053832 [Chionoecetes opilio]|uniref:Uncharacterized protein n=1 Tax=Chionoecetes opilio TaxID=41210 RepID=A0A8J4YAB6_CHIOP|nr:hypothetical protein GWK47_053832 [Chionoecetes opilio]
MLALGPRATDLALLKSPRRLSERRQAGMGQGEGPGTVDVPEELVGPLPFDEATVARRSGPSPSAMQQRRGEKNPASPRRRRPSTQWSSAPWRVCDDQLCRPRHRPGGPVTISSTSTGRVVGRDDTPGPLVGAPVTYGW